MGGFDFRRWLGPEAGAVNMPGSLVMQAEEIHHVEPGPHHEAHRKEISNYYDIHTCPWAVVYQLLRWAVEWRLSRPNSCEIGIRFYHVDDVDVDEQVDAPEEEGGGVDAPRAYRFQPRPLRIPRTDGDGLEGAQEGGGTDGKSPGYSVHERSYLTPNLIQKTAYSKGWHAIWYQLEHADEALTKVGSNHIDFFKGFWFKKTDIWNMKSNEFPMNPTQIWNMKKSPQTTSLGNIFALMSYML